MKDRWLEDIHDKMAEFEANEPSELWQRIESGHHGVTPPRRGFFMTWRPWVAAAMMAVTAGLIWLLVDFSHDKNLGLPSNEDIAQIKNGEKTVDLPQLTQGSNCKAFQVNDTVDKSKDNDLEQGGVTSAHSNLYQGSDIDRASSDTGLDVVAMTNRPETEERSVESTPHDTISSPDNEKDAEVTATDSSVDLLPRFTDEPVYIRPRDKGNRFTVGVYTSGGMTGINTSGSGNLDYTMSPSNPGYDGDDDLPGNKTRTMSSRSVRKVSERSIKHNMPLRFGVALAYNVTPRLSVETGLSYSRLSSDIEHLYYSNNYYLNGEQLLHYIGVPVNLKYRFASWRMLSFYGSAGVLTEKLVSGSVSGYTTSGAGNRVSSPVTEKPWQWSGNAGVGVQFNFTRQIGVYAEPGIGYYFDNGSGVKNVYKDRNLNFTLNMGFRFSFGK